MTKRETKREQLAIWAITGDDGGQPHSLTDWQVMLLDRIKKAMIQYLNWEGRKGLNETTKAYP